MINAISINSNTNINITLTDGYDVHNRNYITISTALTVVGHISIAPGFKPRQGYVRKVFRLSPRLIAFGGHSAHLAYFVLKGVCKTLAFAFFYGSYSSVIKQTFGGHSSKMDMLLGGLGCVIGKYEVSKG